MVSSGSSRQADSSNSSPISSRSTKARGTPRAVRLPFTVGRKATGGVAACMDASAFTAAVELFREKKIISFGAAICGLSVVLPWVSWVVGAGRGC